MELENEALSWRQNNVMVVAQDCAFRIGHSEKGFFLCFPFIQISFSKLLDYDIFAEEEIVSDVLTYVAINLFLREKPPHKYDSEIQTLVMIESIHLMRYQ